MYKFPKKMKNDNSPDAEKIAGSWHFEPKDNVRSDVLGSYTGNPAPEGAPPDDADLYPVQDVDDL